MLPDPTSPDFPAALKAAREAAGLTRTEFARRAKINGVMPRRYEEPDAQDFTRPTRTTWLWLNFALGFSAAPPSPEPLPVVEPATGVSLAQASIDQIVAELRSRGATLTLSFSG